MKLQRSYRDEDVWDEVSEADTRKHLGKYYGNVNGSLRDLARGDVIYAGDFKFRAARRDKSC